MVREGERCRVGNVLCSIADLRVKAARERRLIEAGPTACRQSGTCPSIARPPLAEALMETRRLQLTPGRAGSPQAGIDAAGSGPVIDAGKEPFCACRLVVPPGADPTGRPTLDGGT